MPLNDVHFFCCLLLLLLKVFDRHWCWLRFCKHLGTPKSFHNWCSKLMWGCEESEADCQYVSHRFKSASYISQLKCVTWNHLYSFCFVRLDKSKSMHFNCTHVPASRKFGCYVFLWLMILECQPWLTNEIFMTPPQFFSIFLHFPLHVPSSPIHAISDHSLKAFQLHANLTQAEISLNQSQLTSYDQTK